MREAANWKDGGPFGLPSLVSAAGFWVGTVVIMSVTVAGNLAPTAGFFAAPLTAYLIGDWCMWVGSRYRDRGVGARLRVLVGLFVGLAWAIWLLAVALGVWLWIESGRWP